MAKLTTAARKAIPKSEFGVPSKAPGSGSFPMPDKAHARAAIALSGHAAPAARVKIIRMAKQKLGQVSKHPDGSVTGKLRY